MCELVPWGPGLRWIFACSKVGLRFDRLRLRFGRRFNISLLQMTYYMAVPQCSTTQVLAVNNEFSCCKLGWKSCLYEPTCIRTITATQFHIQGRARTRRSIINRQQTSASNSRFYIYLKIEIGHSHGLLFSSDYTRPVFWTSSKWPGRSASTSRVY